MKPDTPNATLAPSERAVVLRFLHPIVLVLALLAVEITPSLPRYFGVAVSMALGTAIAAMIVVAGYLVLWIADPRTYLKHHGYVDFAFVAFLSLCVLAIVPHAAVADIFRPLSLGRIAASLPLLVVFLLGAVALTGILCCASDAQVHRSVRITVAFFLLFMVFRLIGLQPLGDRFEKPVFPFTETSHFAVAFAPLLLYQCASGRGYGKLRWLAFGVVAALVMKSMTLLLAGVLATLVCRRLVSFSIVGLVLAAGVVPFDLEYFAQRIDFTSGEQNLSTLAYLLGWQLIGESLTETSGWGLGFQQLGVGGSNTPAAHAIYEMAGEYLNLTDGSFVLAKVVSEFGIFGIVVSIAFCVLALRSLLILRRTEHGGAAVFAHCVILAYTGELLARGPGYFTGTTLTVVAAVGVLATKSHFTTRAVRTLREIRDQGRSLQFASR